MWNTCKIWKHRRRKDQVLPRVIALATQNGLFLMLAQ